jgi:Kef-type K+ transport system membrane component KefB
MYTDEFIRNLGELGILFFMLYVGMETSPRLLRTTSKYGILVAAGGIFVPLLLGSLLGVFFDLGGLTLVFVALAVSVTALPVTIRILTDLEVLKTKTSGVIISAALITDVILLFALGVVLGTAEQGESAETAIYLSLSIAAFFALALLIGKFVVPRLYKLLRWMQAGRHRPGIGRTNGETGRFARSKDHLRLITYPPILVALR